jgi:hypothetical protein
MKKIDDGTSDYPGVLLVAATDHYSLRVTAVKKITKIKSLVKDYSYNPLMPTYLLGQNCVPVLKH